MTPEQRDTLMKLSTEYGESLDRMDDEKQHQKVIAARAQRECTVKSVRFIRLATAIYKDNIQQEREDLNALDDLFALASGEKP
jgi:hypothetical protein